MVFDQNVLQNSMNSPSLVLKALEAAMGKAARLSLTISDLKTQGTSTSSITITVLDTLSPTIIMTSNFPSNEMNSNQILKITAQVQIPFATSGNISWLMLSGDKSQSQLSTLLSTPLSQSFTAAIPNDILNFFMVLPANILTPGATYGFGLKCIVAQDSSRSRTNAIVVNVNLPPSPGNFSDNTFFRKRAG